MFEWIKKNQKMIITVLVSVALCIWLYSCESQVKSLDGSGQLVNRAELQLELDRFMGMAQVRMADLDKQDAFRALIIENSLLLVQGTPFNPVGLITAIAGIYGITHGASKVVRTVKKSQDKRKANNG
ncbi:unnamed protein product [marine sediment metagenome]|uniref:Uncharacterized protein n=1 Tax=marine sediment metagenome TaxID=412755 RepID=X1S0L0_9ZZZZ